MVYYHIYIYTDRFADFELTFEIFKTIKQLIPQNQLIAANFNRYKENGEDQLPAHITIRVDLGNYNLPDKIRATLKRWKDEGHIDGSSIDHPAVRGFNLFEQTYFFTAHETASACALTFYEAGRQYPQRIRTIYSSVADLTSFLKEFIPLLLEKSRFAKMKNIALTNDAFINEIAELCATTFLETIKPDLIDHDFNFTERFTHNFFNCILIIGDIEVEIYKYLIATGNSLESTSRNLLFKE